MDPTWHADECLSCTLQGFRERAEAQGTPAPAATAIWRGFMVEGAHPSVKPDERRCTEIVGDQDTRKFALRHEDGAETESVLLPGVGKTGRRRTTLCVSSQVGCAMGCTFCATATMGRNRNLQTAEILAQWHCATHELGASIDNIVFMGMGEPMDNFDNILQAIKVLTDGAGPAIGARHIGVSTVGHVEGIERLTQAMAAGGLRSLRLAVSINSPDDERRSELMPITRRWGLDEVADALRKWIAAGGRPLLLEWVLIPGVTDNPQYARALADRFGDIPCRVNVIPYNPIEGRDWIAPDQPTIDTFMQAVADTGMRVHRRATLGRKAGGACGQLITASIRRRTPAR
ncbi:MAG: 23S rRNA (adenine(2503)-C(2))-methyltransferase RlmN [Phycisphaerales bacterium]|nr:23S rRNA (adenine(2503)-C(2))-methyltransferase RlmN [Phycisphaerales bacterium]